MPRTVPLPVLVEGLFVIVGLCFQCSGSLQSYLSTLLLAYSEPRSVHMREYVSFLLMSTVLNMSFQIPKKFSDLFKAPMDLLFLRFSF